MIFSVVREDKINCEMRDLQIGDKFEVAGIPMVVIGVNSETVTVQQYAKIEDHIFDKDGTTKYEKSDIKEYIETEYEAKYPKTFLDLMNGGHFFLLSEEDVTPGKTKYPYYQKIENRSKYDSKGYATFWWLRSPSVGHGYFVRGIRPAGGVYYSSAYNSNGVAPACVLHLTSN